MRTVINTHEVSPAQRATIERWVKKALGVSRNVGVSVTEVWALPERATYIIAVLIPEEHRVDGKMGVLINLLQRLGDEKSGGLIEFRVYADTIGRTVLMACYPYKLLGKRPRIKKEVARTTKE